MKPKHAEDDLRGFARPIAAATLFLLTAWPGGRALAGDDAQLSGRNYSDKLSGFLLTPPAGCQQIRTNSSAELVKWVQQDFKPGSFAWAVGVKAVAQVKDPNKPEPTLGGFAKALPEYLKTSEGLETTSVDLTIVDGKGAVDVRGTASDLFKFWRRQVWVQAEPSRFLVFWISGPADDKDNLDKLLQAVLGTVKTFNRMEVLKAQQASLLNGRMLLADLAKRKVAPAENPQWFAFRQDGKVVGWMLQLEAAATHETHDGIEVKSLTMLRLPKDLLRISNRVFFATATGEEQWKETLAVGEVDKQAVTEETGLRQGDLIVCTISQGTRKTPHRKPVPLDANEPRQMYLPHAFGTILPRLVDLSKPCAYAFATYSSSDNDYKLRTLTVLGPQAITVAGRRVDATHLTDVEEANDEAASEIWVDSKGIPLRIKGAGWPDIDASTRDEIISSMPESRKVIEDVLKR